ncbi:hypothetical protein CYMTET_48375 [Cymbomonas tetramitiformis]|uniref:Uncharacterized protein n=1 Tax=Cymbomonas tetramitiformis TaxID=36881 RepID=A0AAE0BTG2_9CHLO|nr:hypothetical protein CYMTET_48375 [Cymbomonas tetramitiformis]
MQVFADSEAGKGLKPKQTKLMPSATTPHTILYAGGGGRQVDDLVKVFERHIEKAVSTLNELKNTVNHQDRPWRQDSPRPTRDSEESALKLAASDHNFVMVSIPSEPEPQLSIQHAPTPPADEPVVLEEPPLYPAPSIAPEPPFHASFMDKMMAGSTLVEETDPAPEHILSMHGMAAPTGVFVDDMDVHVIDYSEIESDGPDEIGTGYIDEPELPVDPRLFSAGGAGMFKPLLHVLCLSMLIACDTAAPPSMLLSAGAGTYGSVVLPQYATGNAFDSGRVCSPIDTADFHTAFADEIATQFFNQPDPAKTDSSDVDSYAFHKFFSADQNCTVEYITYLL